MERNTLISSSSLEAPQPRAGRTKDVVQVLLVSTYDYIGIHAYDILVLDALSYLFSMPLSYIFHGRYHPCSARPSSLYLQCFPPCCLLLLLLLFLLHYYYYFITSTSIKLLLLINRLRARLLSGAAELTTHLLRLVSILWLSLCQINKLGCTTLEDCGDPIYLWVITPRRGKGQGARWAPPSSSPRACT